METVYIVLIVAAAVVILAVVYMLRRRITEARAGISVADRVKAEGMLKANGSSRYGKTETKTERPSRGPLARSGIVGNVLEWWSRIRVPLNTRVVNNILRVGSKIEVFSPQETSRDQADSAQDEVD